MISDRALLFPIGRLSYLLGHMARLTFFAGLDGPALIPIAEQIVGLAQVRRRRHRLMAVQAQIGLLKQAQFHRLVREILNEILVWPIQRLSTGFILRLRGMFGPIYLLDQMALAAGNSIQGWIACFRLINKELGGI